MISKALASIRTHGVGDRTVEACWQLLRAAFNRAVDYELVLASPMKRVPRPKLQTREARSFDVAQVAMFFESLAGDPLYPIVVTAIFSGLRRSELCGLKWSDVNWMAQTITVRRSVHRVGSHTITASPKSKKARVIPVPALLLDVLLTHQKDSMPTDLTMGELVDYDERYVFGTTEPFDPWSLSSKFAIAMKRISRETSLLVIRLHDCRRTFASLLVNENLGAKHISEALGHHSPSYSLEVSADILNTPVSDATNRIDEKMRRLLGQ